MKLSEVKQVLPTLEQVVFELENGTTVPSHFHVTEIGLVEKKFIDCGGVLRQEKKISFQLWNADDVDHSLNPQKLLQIIHLSEQKLGITDEEIEVEYQGETIGKYALSIHQNKFILQNLQTACLALDACGIGVEKPNLQVEPKTNCCSSTGGCC